MLTELQELQVFNMDEVVRQTIYHGTADITNLVTSTRFTQRENGVTDLEFTTATEGKARFDININDRISVAYDDGVHGNRKVFDGYIENKEHSISEQGEFVKFFTTDSVCAVLKRMIVNLDFGTQSRIGMLNPNVDQKLSNVILQILHDYVARVSGNPINQNKPNSFSDFKTNYWINDGYIWKEPNSIKFPFLSMKYCNALEAITNLAKLYGALSFKRAIDTNGTQPYRGVHWISDAENNLIIAPVGNHDVQSTAGNQIAGLWHTYANNGAVLTFGQDDILSFNFVEEAPLANLVYVSGKYKWPPNDELTENSAKYWGNSWGISGFPIQLQMPGSQISDSTIAVSRNKKSLKLMANAPNPNTTACYNLIPAANSWESITNLISSDTAASLFYTPINAEFLNLITPESPAYINFTCYKDPDVTRTNVLLMNNLGFTTNGNTTTYSTPKCFSKQFNVGGDNVERVSVEILYEDIVNDPIATWKPHGAELPSPINPNPAKPDWNSIKYLGFTFRKSGVLPGTRDMSLYIDDLSLSGSVIRGVTDANMWSLTEDVGDGYWVRNRRMNPAYKFPLRMFTVKDSLAFSDNLLSEPQSSDSLYLSALAHLIQYGSPMIRGTVTIPLNTNYLAGQFLRIKNGRDSNWYKDSNADYKTFRITDVTHSFSESGAITTLNVCNDLINGTPRQNNEYTEAVRALSPRWQDQTFASLFTENSWDNDAYIAASRVNLSKIDF